MSIQAVATAKQLAQRFGARIHLGALIADFDIEYVNFDNPAEAFVDPERVFAIQQPVEQTIQRLLEEYRIEPLHILSGRGHHFVWRIEQNSAVFGMLSGTGFPFGG
jgi:hypothetical protein